MITSIFLTGPSCSGKTTLAKHLINKYPTIFKLNISYTTRNARENELHGREYYFISKNDFEIKIQEGFFAEYVQFSGNYYGVAKTALETNQIEEDNQKKDKITLFTIETQGIKYFNEERKNKLFIVIKITKETLIQRLKHRTIYSQNEFQRRLETVDIYKNFEEQFSFDEELNTETTIDETEKELDLKLKKYKIIE
ncbi:gmk [Nucleospora cyclopteri]